MDQESRKFGRGPRELTGAADLISYYRLQTHHDFFCKKLLPVAVIDTHYLHNVVGDVEIRRGEGMELDQLFHGPPYLPEKTSKIQPFDLDALGQAFLLQESTPIELPSADKGKPTISVNLRDGMKNKEKHKRQKDKDGKDKEHKRHKHRHKNMSKDRDGGNERSDKNLHCDAGGSLSKKHHNMKRKQEGNEDMHTHNHMNNKHRVLNVNDVGLMKMAR